MASDRPYFGRLVHSFKSGYVKLSIRVSSTDRAFYALVMQICDRVGYDL